MDPTACPPAEFTPNRNHARRDEILGTSTVHYSGGIKPFARLCAAGLATLLAERFIAPDARQNASPTAREFLRFLERWPQATAHGYAVSRRRDDYRVSIEGLLCDLRAAQPSDRERLRGEFERFCRGADELVSEGDALWAWWD